MTDPFEAIAETGRRMKLDKVKEHGGDADEDAADLIPFVVCVRQGRQVAQVMSGPGTEGTRNAVYLAALFMRSDELYLIADSYMMTASEDEPLPQLKAGQLQEEWAAGRRDHIRECMMIQRFPRIGPSLTVAYPYERQGRRLKWLDRSRFGEIRGAVPDYARQGWENAAKVWPEMAKTLDLAGELSGLSKEEQEYHTDRAVAGLASKQGGGLVALMLPDGVAVFSEGEEIDPVTPEVPACLRLLFNRATNALWVCQFDWPRPGSDHMLGLMFTAIEEALDTEPAVWSLLADDPELRDLPINNDSIYQTIAEAVRASLVGALEPLVSDWMQGVGQPWPPPDQELDFDTAEALGFDGTNRDGRAPVTVGNAFCTNASPNRDACGTCDGCQAESRRILHQSDILPTRYAEPPNPTTPEEGA